MQAYTVELEAELNLLKEENEKLKQTLVHNIEIEDSCSYIFFLNELCFFDV